MSANDDIESREITTLGKLIADLNEYARLLPEGTGTPVRLAVCDGNGMQFIDTKDLGYWTFMARDDPGTRHTFVLVRGHAHPGESPGQYSPGITAGADDELRKIAAEGEDEA